MESKTLLWRWLALVLVVSVLARAGLWLAYPLAESNDTPTYRHLAASLGNHGFDRYNGTRTPGYPIFILLAGSDAALYALQLTLGVITTLLVFFIAWRLTRSSAFAGLMALAHTLSLGQLFFEAAVLSESLSTFLLFVVLAGLTWLWVPKSPEVKSVSVADFVLLAGAGLAAAALAMVRPLFAPVAFWGAFFLAFFWRAVLWKTRWGAAMLFVLPSVLVLGLWVTFIHANFKIWGFDSIGGYHLVNHASSFFERAPAQYAPIRDTFLQFRAKRMAATGSPVNTIWDAIPALMEQQNLNYYALGRLMGQISQRLIVENPGLYLRNLFLGWGWFWKVGVFWLPGAFRWAVLSTALSAVMLIERGMLFILNLFFLAVPLTFAWKKIRVRLQPPLFIGFAASLVWLTSILQTLAEHGDNARFLAPMQTLVVITAGWAVFRFIFQRA